MLRRFLFVILLTFGFATTALAERRVALVLAAQDYRHLRPLANPVNDARAIEDMLKTLGFEVWTETDRDLRRMRRALEDFRADGAGADLALVFYAGHGVAIDGVNYLLPVDAEAKSAGALAETSLPLSEVQEVLAAISPNAVLLLDACRDDPFAGTGASDPDGRGAVALADDSADAPKPVPGLGRIGRADGALIAFAAAPGETASDGTSKNSPFTEALLRYFGTEGTELRLALTLVQEDVYDRSRGRQMPYIESGLPRLIYLSGAGELPERALLLLAMNKYTPELRAEVEAMAAQNDMPLAPLYRAVMTGDLDRLSGDERRVKLEEAAHSYALFETDLLKHASDNPRVAELRAKAEEQFALGATDAGRALMAEAAQIDDVSEVALRDNMVTRTLSQASTHVLNANAARASLRYDLAISDLTRATELYNRVSADLPDREAKASYSLALSDLTALYQLAGNSSGALSISLSLVDYLERLTRAEPEDIGWRRELIWALKSAGEIKVQQGFLIEADADYSKAETLTAAMLALHPDDRDIMREREVILNSRGAVRLSMADHQGALSAHQEALTIALALYEKDPENTLLRRGAASIQSQIGDVLLAMGDTGSALMNWQNALEQRRQLADLDPQNAVWLRDLSISWERIGDLYLREGALDEAVAAAGEALALRQAVVDIDPSNLPPQRDLTLSLEKMAEAYEKLGDATSAREFYDKSVEIRRWMVATAPTVLLYRRDLAYSLGSIGDLMARNGEPAAALPLLDEARELREAALAEAIPDVVNLRELSVGLNIQVRVLLTLNDTGRAVEIARRSVEVMDQAAALRPGDIGLTSDRGFAAGRLGDALQAAGDLPGALAAFREMAGFYFTVSSADPWSVRAAQDYALALELSGHVLMMQENYPAAQQDLEAAVALRKWVTGQLPASILDQRSLGYGLQNLADAYYFAQDYENGRPHEEAALAILRWIAGVEPENAYNIIDLATALYRASYYYRDGSLFLTEAVALLKALDAEGRMPEGNYRDRIAEYEERLRAIQASGGTPVGTP